MSKLKELESKWSETIDKMEKLQDQGQSVEHLVKERDRLAKKIEFQKFLKKSDAKRTKLK